MFDLFFSIKDNTEIHPDISYKLLECINDKDTTFESLTRSLFYYGITEENNLLFGTILHYLKPFMIDRISLFNQYVLCTGINFEQKYIFEYGIQNIYDLNFNVIINHGITNNHSPDLIRNMNNKYYNFFEYLLQKS